MNIALVNPFTPDGNFVPPLGLLTIAAILEQEGHAVAVFDENSGLETARKVADFRPGLVGFTAVTSAVNRARKLAGEIRNLCPGAPTVFGGPHPTSLPGEVMSWPEADFVVAGEGERAMSGLAAWVAARGTASQLAQIPNLYHRCSGMVAFTGQTPFLTSDELDRLPLPAYHLLDIATIAERLRHGLFRRGKRALTYMASRGCPHQCTFCCRVMGSAVRRKSPALVLQEIERLVETYDLDEIYFEDDNFTATRRYAMSVLNGIIERRLPISIKFANGVRIDTLDDELLDAMRLAGCHALSFGLESGSRRTLELMRKNLDLDRVARVVEMVRRHGFTVGANMIIGYPGETVENIMESYRYFQSLRLDSAAVVNLIPFPGTEVRRICEEQGYLTPAAADWDNYYFDINSPRILIETEELPQEELRRIMRKLFVRFYTNPRRVWGLVRQLGPRDLLAGARVLLGRMGGA